MQTLIKTLAYLFIIFCASDIWAVEYGKVYKDKTYRKYIKCLPENTILCRQLFNKDYSCYKANSLADESQIISKNTPETIALYNKLKDEYEQQKEHPKELSKSCKAGSWSPGNPDIIYEDVSYSKHEVTRHWPYDVTKCLKFSTDIETGESEIICSLYISDEVGQIVDLPISSEETIALYKQLEDEYKTQHADEAIKLEQEIESKDVIEFKGKRKKLMQLIQESKSNPQHPFSTTSVFRLTGDQFIYEGDVYTLNQQGTDDIAHSNYVYCPYWGLIQTRLSHGLHVENAAIILGTTDKEKCSKLHFAGLKAILKQAKEQKKGKTEL